MDPKKLLKFCLENGLLIDEDVLKLLSEASDLESAKLVIEKIKDQTHKKILTKEVFLDREQVSKLFLDIPAESQKRLEKLKIKLGLRIEISKEVLSKKIMPREKEEKTLAEENLGVKVLSKAHSFGKKYEVGDFLKSFRNRFSTLRNILQNRTELENPVSIDKISGYRQGVSLIGMVLSKRVTKNKNLLLEIEDFTGRIRVLVNQNKKDVYEKAQGISLDSVIGFTGSGSKEIFFVNDVVFPDARILQKKKSPVEEYALFIGDVQCGNHLFMEENFLKFISYINGKVPDTPLSEIAKIKYLIITGDVVEGVGVFPRQEKELSIKDLEDQYMRFAELLSKIRKDIAIIISPGNHDGVRLMEPQPTFDEKYAWPLYNLKNVVLLGNPAYINIGAKKDFEGFNVLIYHGFSYPYYADNTPLLIKLKHALNYPDKIMSYLLKHRHLAPAHKSTQFSPLEEDGLVIRHVPDIFASGHTHKMAISNYNNILLISTATWEAQNKFQERMGNEPDFCKVPMLNLKTRQIKVLDFEDLASKEGKEEEKPLEVQRKIR